VSLILISIALVVAKAKLAQKARQTSKVVSEEMEIEN